jgi:glycosyltransferase involved in cell wall biosynthesis
LTIALDATYSTGTELSGVGLYSHEILYGLAAAHPEARFDFCYRPHRYFRERGIALPANARRRLLLEPIGPRGCDLFHGLNQRLPGMRMRRSVATFHDLFVMSGEYSTPEFRARFTEQARDAAARADAIIAVSEFTRQQVVELLGVEPSRIHVVHHGIRRMELPRNLPAMKREAVILNVGAIQARKNTGRLVEAFEAVDASWRLVLAGSAGYGSEKIQERIALSPARERITVTGYVSPEELAGWYARASIFAFPSLDEGFGMPVLEAMAAGVPVVTSQRSALPEVAGDAAMLIDPESTPDLAEALRRLTGDDSLRMELIRRGQSRARLFSWEKAVGETWNVYRKLLG